ncbi:hypothetical protein IT397_01405 [Candidatus Nomurabacteria bacterium]|nr:hypothetical protein [Candidatus Nomurabacteria bacterium]
MDELEKDLEENSGDFDIKPGKKIVGDDDEVDTDTAPVAEDDLLDVADPEENPDELDIDPELVGYEE